MLPEHVLGSLPKVIQRESVHQAGALPEGGDARRDVVGVRGVASGARQ